MKLCGSLSILWGCLSYGLEWKLTFSSSVATSVFSKFSGVLSAVLSQHHLLGFKIAQLNGIETCMLSRVKEITSPGWMHETSASHILISDAPWILWMYRVWSEDWSFAFLTNPQVMAVVLVLTALGVLELSENMVLGCGRNGGADTSTRTLELPLLWHSPLL